MIRSTSSLTEIQRQGRTLFLCALALIACFFASIVYDTYISGRDRVFDIIWAGLMYLFAIVWIYRGSPKALKYTKGCLGLLALVCFGIASIIIPVLLNRGLIRFADYYTLEGLYSIIPLVLCSFVYWVFFFSNSVRCYLAYRHSLKEGLADSKVQPIMIRKSEQ